MCDKRRLQTADLQTADLQTCRPADLQASRLADSKICRPTYFVTRLWANFIHPLFTVISEVCLRQITAGCKHSSAQFDRWLEILAVEDFRGSLRWLSTVLAVCEYMSFAKLWQEKGCSSQAETWQVKNILIKDFDWQVKCVVFVVPWQHERLNTTLKLHFCSVYIKFAH